MARKISERERLLTYSYTADKEELEEAIEIFRTALKSRFGGGRKKGAQRGRKQGTGNSGTDAGTAVPGDDTGRNAMAAR